MAVSIVIPAYNASKYLAEAIDSALAQFTPAREVIVLDDGSRDSTPNVAKAFGSRIRYVRQSNSGVSAARNAGAALATAPWLLFLDADDRLLPMALHILISRAKIGKAGVAYGQTIHFGSHTGERRLHGDARSEGPIPAAVLANFWKSAIATPGAAMVRKDLFLEIGGFNTAFSGVADRDFWLRAGMTEQFGFAPAPVIEKRTHGANMCAAADEMLPEALRVQFDFLDRCGGRGIDLGFLKAAPCDIVDFALRQTFDRRLPRALKSVVRIADDRKVSSPLLRRAAPYATLSLPALRLALLGRECLHWMKRNLSRAAEPETAPVNEC